MSTSQPRSKISNLIPAVNENPAGDAWGQKLVCPHCGSDYVYPGSPIIFEGDYYRSPFDNRGSSYVIPFYCEQGGCWLVSFSFHKGNTYLQLHRNGPVVKALCNAEGENKRPSVERRCNE